MYRRYSNYLYTITLVLILFSSASVFGDQEIGIEEIFGSTAVEVCRGGNTSRGTSTLEADANLTVKDGLLKKLSGFEIGGKLVYKKSEIDGIEPLIPDSYTDFKECAISITTLYMNTLVPIYKSKISTKKK